ncbi:unnamed protein product [Camellia sinensis]
MTRLPASFISLGFCCSEGPEWRGKKNSTKGIKSKIRNIPTQKLNILILSALFGCPEKFSPKPNSGLCHAFLLLQSINMCGIAILGRYSVLAFPGNEFLYSCCRKAFTWDLQQVWDFHEEGESYESCYGELQKRMQGYATSGCIKEAIETLNFMRNVPGKPTVYDYNALIHCYSKSKHVLLEELVGVYVAMKRFGPYPNASTFNTLLNGMLSHGNIKDVFIIAEEMCTSGFIPSFSFLSKLLKKSLKSGYLIDALRVFKLMLRLDYCPAEPNLNLLIVCLSKAGMITEAFFVFSVLLERDSFRGAYSYNPILWALCKSGQSYTALALFYSLKKKGLAHNVCSYTALVYGFSRERLWEEAFRCLAEMQTCSCKPNVITYTAVVKFLCDDGKIEEALGLLDKMEKEGCDPDLVTYNIILHKLCHQSRVAEIGELVRVIDQKGLYPDPFTHAALAGGLLKGGKIGVATKFLLDIISRGCTVDVVIYNIYFNILCHENRSSESLSLLRSMMEIGFRPNNVSYNTILKGFCKDNIDEALELFDHIEWGVNGPDIVSFNTILSAACKQGNSPMIRRIFYRMEYEGIKLNVVSSTCLIQYFCMVGKIPEGLKLLEAMTSNGPSPTIVTFNTLMSSLCKNQLLGIALRIFKYLKGTGLLPDMIAYNILIRASIREGNDQLMGQLLREMSSLSLKPDAVTFGSFIYGLCKGGKISEAFQLRNQMIENGITPSIAIYNTLLEALLKRGKFWDIILLLKEMVMEGCEPNAVSFEILSRTITKGWMKGYPRATKLLEFFMSANEVLSDPQKRAIYDQYGEEGLKDMPVPGSGGSSGFPDGYNPQNAEDIFAEFFGSSPFGLGSAGAGRSMRFQSDGGMFGEFGGNNNIFRLYSDRSGANVPKKPPPIESKLPCSFEALYNGSTRKTKISRTVLDANGRLVPESEILTIEVKPGWKKGTKITFPDKGNEPADPRIRD